MVKIRHCLLLICLLSSYFTTAHASCVLTMGYKEGDKLPLIGKSPDNSGVYQELFSKAAQQINCELKIVRLPKKRLHNKLATGEIDFYPGASFSHTRASYLYFVKNGLHTAQYGITLPSVPEITEYFQVKAFNLQWLMELGSSKYEIAKRIGARTQIVKFVDIDKARKLLEKGRNNFYVADKELIDYYLLKHGVETLSELGLKVHHHCCGGDSPMYLGFSRESKYFEERPNPNYDPSALISPQNFPSTIKVGTIAHQLQQALNQLEMAGESQQLYQRRFHMP
ncbi:ABC transporter substrate-binding protein [Psychrobium sp. 1_MG-2023]|uniref:substrate-binding periplasmic protein n=1 Tax=Psychrobium sp. 1_MG-2023 TaxID=3062624 RepID=UPI000C345012|nr:transporter substrate-binding domain-containing protein [Psychrobium sp. 1_MG-2023]MDP2560194.1 transporter substrate-binding domain-containing protein [Psychrobium sp. 1_MG-2023]PKF57005.1 hypothetical protein CW748_07875 [Alteromonadales bacterium alter-6D02]